MSNVLNFNVVKNTLELVDGAAPVSSELNYSELVCHFKEDDDWADISILTAGFFVYEDEVYQKVGNIIETTVEESTEITAAFSIPSQLCGNQSPIYFGLCGSILDNGEVVKTISTNAVAIDIRRGVLITSLSENAAEEASICEQLLAALNAGLATKANSSDVYTKTATDELLAAKANSSDVTAALATKADSNHTHSQYLTAHQDISGKEDKSNKVTSMSGSSTDTQYPSAKAVYDAVSAKVNSSDVTKTSDIRVGSNDELIKANNSGVLGRSGYSVDGNSAHIVNSPSANSKVPTAKAVAEKLAEKADADHTHSQYLTSHQDISGKEDKTNKVTSMSSDSTDTQYPSAKAVYDAVSAKANSADVYNKTAADALLSAKAAVDDTWAFVNLAGSNSSLKRINELTTDAKTIYRVCIDYNWGLLFNIFNINYHSQIVLMESGDILYRSKAVSASWGNISFTSIIPSKTSDLTNDSGFLTSHQDISGKANLSDVFTKLQTQNEIWNSIDQTLSANSSGDYPRLTIVQNSGKYYLTYYECNGDPHYLFDISSLIPSKTSDLTNDSGFIPLVEVDSIDDCTENGILYLVNGEEERVSVFYYILNLKWMEISNYISWMQIRINSDFTISIRTRSNEPFGGGWAEWTDFTNLEDTYNRINAITNANKASTDIYPSVKAVVDYIAAQGFLTSHQDISGKANASDVTTALAAKADSSSVYTQSEIDAMLLSLSQAYIVNDTSEMINTSRFYVLASTGHVWRYATTSTEPPNELSVQSDKYNKRISGTNISGTTSSGTGTFIADPIAVDLTGTSCTVTFKNFAAAMASHSSTTSYGYSKIVALDENQAAITNAGLMMSHRNNNDEWQITASGDDMIGDLVMFADILVSKGAISSKSQIKYIVFSPMISSSSISSSDIANMGIYISNHGGTTNAWVDTGIVYGGGNETELLALDTRITTAENNIAALASSGTAVIPSYWESEVEDTISKVRTLQNESGHNLLCFGWCSDMHIHASGTVYEQNLGAVAARVMNECDIPLFLITGDMLTADSATTATTAVTAYKKAWEYLAPIGKEKILVTKGNHDAWFGNDGNGNSYVYGLSPNELYRNLFAPQAKDLRRVFSDDGSYFYLDNIPQKTRFICLNSQWADYTEDANGRALYSTQKGAGFGQAQLNWLIQKALNVEDGYSIVIAFHAPPTAQTHSSYAGFIREYDVIRGIITAYCNKTTYSGSYSHSTAGTAYKQEDTWADVSVSCDFSNYHGTLLALFCGHSHYDQAVTGDLPVPIVCITSAINTPYDTAASVRVSGTSTETAMDFVCINRSTGDIDLVRCGYGSDRTVTVSS